MKKTLYISALVMMLAGTSFTSCSDFLNAEDKGHPTSDAYFATTEGFENLCTTSYYKLRAVYDTYTGETPGSALFISGTDLYETGRSGVADGNLQSYSALVADSKAVSTFYQNCYDGIQQANAVIHYAGSDASRAKRADEALTLKCFYYYLLSQQFGGVPVSDSYIANSSRSYPKTSLPDLYAYLIQNLKKVADNGNLPDVDHTGRVSKRFVYNLLAKVNLAAGWDLGVDAGDAGLKEGQQATANDTGKKYFEEAAKYAELAIGGATLTMDFSKMWDVNNENNDDVIFAIQYTRGISGQDETTSGNGLCAIFSNYYSDANNFTKYTTGTFAPSEKLIYLFEPGDKRFEGTFMTTLYLYYYGFYNDKILTDNNANVFGYYPAWYEDLSNLMGYVQESDEHSATKVFSTSNPSVFVNSTTNPRTGRTTYSQGKQTYTESRTGTGTSLCIRKFDDYTAVRNGTSRVSFHDIVLAHLSETYLIAAEAYYMSGQSDKALEKLNAVRSRSAATTLNDWSEYVRHYSDGTANSYNSGSGIDNVPKLTGADLDPIDIILDERARELCGEGYRWMDLRRTKRLIDYNVKYNSSVSSASAFIGNNDGKNKWFRPIPSGEIRLNDALTDEDQNDGYK